MNPIRSCIGCRKTGGPSELMRMVLVDGKVIFDQRQIALGRGAWVHRKCLKLAIDRQALKWAFRLSTMPDVTDLQKVLLTEMDAKDMKLK
jgi:predicted RNA-binding protein YlxR (DUF448 family)